MKEFKPGDVIYSVSRFRSEITKIVIDRVTNTQAISKGYRFKKNYTDGAFMCPIGYNTTFGTVSFYPASEELTEKYLKQEALKKISSVKFNEMNLSSLIKILQFIDETVAINNLKQQ